MARLAYSLTSYFKLPEQGMRVPEPLVRASGFCVVRDTGAWLIGAGHVVHPFSYPHLFPAAEYPWLEFVKPQHISLSIEMRDASGQPTASLPLAPRPADLHFHPRLDVVAVHVGVALLDGLVRAGLDVDLEARLCPRGISGVETYQLLGHNVNDGYDPDSGEDRTLVVPFQCAGAALATPSDEVYRAGMDAAAVAFARAAQDAEAADAWQAGQSGELVGAACADAAEQAMSSETQRQRQHAAPTDSLGTRAWILPHHTTGHSALPYSAPVVAFADDVYEATFHEVEDPRPERRLLDTGKPLEMGMCGGPVLVQQAMAHGAQMPSHGEAGRIAAQVQHRASLGDAVSPDASTIIGVVEGIVPEHSDSDFAGMAVIACSSELLRWLDELEQGPAAGRA